MRRLGVIRKRKVGGMPKHGALGGATSICFRYCASAENVIYKKGGVGSASAKIKIDNH